MLHPLDLRGALPRRPGAAPYMDRTPAEMDYVKFVCFHHTNVGEARPSAIEVARYQTSPIAHTPFPAIAYHLFVEVSGRIVVCHDIETVTWGQGDGSAYQIRGVGSNNWQGIAVAFSGDTPTGAQVESMSDVADALDIVCGRWLDRRVHAQVSIGPDGRALTECPGAGWRVWLDEVGRG